MTIKSLVINLHAGQVARRPHRRRLGVRVQSPLRGIVRKQKPDVVFLTEVRSLVDLRTAMPGYTITGAFKGGYECVAVAIRNKTMREVQSRIHTVAPARDRMHPARNFPVVVAVHKPSGQTVTLLGVHLWSMGQGWSSPEGVVKGHTAQAHKAVDLVDGAIRVLAAGDLNEDIDSADINDERSVVSIFADAGLRFASRTLHQHTPTSLEGKSLLDDVASRGLDVKDRTTLLNPGGGADHRPVTTVHAL